MARRPFYGWVIVAAATIISVVASGFGGMNAGLFVRPMGDDIGLTRTVFGWAAAARQVGSGVVSPIAGRIVDRSGARPVLVGGGVLAAVALIWLSQIDTPSHVVVAFVLLGMTGTFGPGAIAVTTPVTKWFVRDRARAIAWMSIGTPLGVIVFVPLTQVLIDSIGWRATWLVLAAFSLVFIVPAGLLMRRAPEDYGLHPDGLPPVQHLQRRSDADVEESWTAREALRSATYWRLVVVFGLVLMANASVSLHRLPHWTDQGVAASLVSWGTALDAGCAMASTLIAGRLLARYPSRFVGAAGFLILAVAVVLTILSAGPVMMFVSMCTFGTGIGCLLMIQNHIWVDYFGRRNVGRVRGLAMPFTLICSATGPIIAGVAYDAMGTYDPVWWIGATVMVVGALLLATTPPPQRRSPDASLDVHPVETKWVD